METVNTYFKPRIGDYIDELKLEAEETYSPLKTWRSNSYSSSPFSFSVENVLTNLTQTMWNSPTIYQDASFINCLDYSQKPKPNDKLVQICAAFNLENFCSWKSPENNSENFDEKYHTQQSIKPVIEKGAIQSSNLAAEYDSKNELNLALLEGFPYTVERKSCKGYAKLMDVYTWHFENCGKEFLRTWNLLDHARVHNKVKPYVCDCCTKQFTQKGNLKKHMKTHQAPRLRDRKRYQCEFCNSKYTERYNYRVRPSIHLCVNRIMLKLKYNLQKSRMIRVL